MRFIKDKPNSLSLDNLQSFLDNTRGQITLGEIPSHSTGGARRAGQEGKSRSRLR
jgi:hypothetical protein